MTDQRDATADDGTQPCNISIDKALETVTFIDDGAAVSLPIQNL